VVSVAADSSQRMLQDGTDQSQFGLEVSLQGIEGKRNVRSCESWMFRISVGKDHAWRVSVDTSQDPLSSRMNTSFLI
jgi:hypothetical protein